MDMTFNNVMTLRYGSWIYKYKNYHH